MFVTASCTLSVLVHVSIACLSREVVGIPVKEDA